MHPSTIKLLGGPHNVVTKRVGVSPEAHLGNWSLHAVSSAASSSRFLYIQSTSTCSDEDCSRHPSDSTGLQRTPEQLEINFDGEGVVDKGNLSPRLLGLLARSDGRNR